MISVIMPVYKVEKYIKKSVDSVLNQTYPDIEVILVDDGSPDGSGKICDEYAKKDSRVCVIHKKNGGVSSARNVGIEASKGEYIFFLDPDDLIASNTFEVVLGQMQEKNADLVFFGSDDVDTSYKVIDEYKRKSEKIEFIDRKQLFSRIYDEPFSVGRSPCNKMYKREVMGTLRFAEGLHYAEDTLFLFSYAEKCKNAVGMYQSYYFYLVRDGSASHGGVGFDAMIDACKTMGFIYKRTVKAYPDLKDHALSYVLDKCALLYKDAKRNYDGSKENAEKLAKVRKFIRRTALSALFNKEIYWKTRLAYLVIK